MKINIKIWALAAVLCAAGIAHAQPNMTAPAVTATAEARTPGAAAPDTIGAEPDAEDAGTMPTTGGAPLAMMLGGTLTAAGAFFMRRKVTS